MIPKKDGAPLAEMVLRDFTKNITISLFARLVSVWTWTHGVEIFA